jgi:hypothetical protein
MYLLINRIANVITLKKHQSDHIKQLPLFVAPICLFFWLILDRDWSLTKRMFTRLQLCQSEDLKK